jgi:hypothetical protein
LPTEPAKIPGSWSSDRPRLTAHTGAVVAPAIFALLAIDTISQSCFSKPPTEKIIIPCINTSIASHNNKVQATRHFAVITDIAKCADDCKEDHEAIDNVESRTEEICGETFQIAPQR